MYILNEKLSPNEFQKTFLTVKEQYRNTKPHPWNVLFSQGKLTKQQLQGWAKENYYWKLKVPIKDYAILCGCPYPEVRRKWLPKLIEEEGEDLIGGKRAPHPEYWLRFCEGVGLSREYVINADPLPAVKFAIDAWVEGASKSWLLGVAMSETGDVAKGIARNLEMLRKHYPWIPERALEFWLIHSEADVEHSKMSIEILGKYCTTRELQEECINAMLTYANILEELRNAVYFEYVVQGAVCQGSEAAA